MAVTVEGHLYGWGNGEYGCLGNSFYQPFRSNQCLLRNNKHNNKATRLSTSDLVGMINYINNLHACIARLILRLCDLLT